MSKIFETEVHVRFAETDMWGIVYYANYFVWFEVGRGAAFREMKVVLEDWEKNDALAVVVEANCRYKSSARYDDRIIICTTISSIQPKMMTFTYEIVNKTTGKLLATGHTKHMFVDRSGKPSRLTASLIKLISSRAGIKQH